MMASQHPYDATENGCSLHPTAGSLWYDVDSDDNERVRPYIVQDETKMEGLANLIDQRVGCAECARLAGHPMPQSEAERGSGS